MKFAKRLSSVVLIFLLVMGVSITAYGAYAIRCWYAYDLEDSKWIEKNAITTWGKNASIKFCHKKLNTNTEFEFYAGNLHAQNEWETALGISFNNVIKLNDAQLKVYGGTYNELTGIGVDLDNNVVGLTKRITINWVGSSKYNGYNKEIYNVSAVNCYIVDESTSTHDRLKNTCTHEMGHALGWVGHSKEEHDIMYPLRKSYNELNYRDQFHLQQVY